MQLKSKILSQSRHKIIYVILNLCFYLFSTVYTLFDWSAMEQLDFVGVVYSGLTYNFYSLLYMYIDKSIERNVVSEEMRMNELK